MITLPRYECEEQRATLRHGDCLAVLPTLPADHFHCVVCSPPYFALRSYLDKDDPLKPLEIGSEPTPEDFIETMVRVFREVRRVMHPTGLLFLNLGDSYNGSGAMGGGDKQPTNQGSVTKPDNRQGWPGAKSGELLNMPHRVAEALRADGWIWRQTIVWAKRSPMPESCKGWRWERCRVKVASQQDGEGNKHDLAGMRERTSKPSFPNNDGTGAGGNWEMAQWCPCPGCAKCAPHGGYVLRKGRGRCTSAHEFIFVMARSSTYFWDSAAFVEEGTNRPSGNRERKYRHDYGGNPDHTGHQGFAFPWDGAASRNPRSVWHFSSEPTSVPHFATYPSELVRRCIQAGTSDGGCCPECGEPWAPVVETERYSSRPGDNTKIKVPGGWDTKPGSHGTIHREGRSPEAEYRDAVEIGNRDPQRHCTETRILGYRPTCECGADSAPCRVLDPFAGIGTTLQTAQWMQRESVGIELNPEYIAHAEQLIDQPPRWWRRKHQAKPRPADCPGQLRLFDDPPGNGKKGAVLCEES